MTEWQSVYLCRALCTCNTKTFMAWNTMKIQINSDLNDRPHAQNHGTIPHCLGSAVTRGRGHWKVKIN